MAWKNPNVVIFSPAFSLSLSFFPPTSSCPHKNSGQFQPHLRGKENSQTSLSSNNCHENLWLDGREKTYLFFQVTWPLLSKADFASGNGQMHNGCSWPRSGQLTSKLMALGWLQAVLSLAKRDYQVGT